MHRLLFATQSLLFSLSYVGACMAAGYIHQNKLDKRISNYDAVQAQLKHQTTYPLLVTVDFFKWT